MQGSGKKLLPVVSTATLLHHCHHRCHCRHRLVVRSSLLAAVSGLVVGVVLALACFVLVLS